jgi:hypothetical protein
MHNTTNLRIKLARRREQRIAEIISLAERGQATFSDAGELFRLLGEEIECIELHGGATPALCLTCLGTGWKGADAEDPRVVCPECWGSGTTKQDFRRSA